MSKEIIKANEQALAELNDLFPREQNQFTRISLPRLSFVSQDVTEGKGKTLKVITEAGSFIKETPTEEVDENGKKVWQKEDLGKSIQATILYYRYQLSMYDESSEAFFSTPVFDKNTEVLPLFSKGKKVAEGTPAELKKLYEFVDTKDKKTKSKLRENRVLYVLYEGELYQMTLHGSSMYSFIDYKKNIVLPAVLSKISSTEEEKGSTQWNKASFETISKLDNEELSKNIQSIKEIITAIQAEKGTREDPTVTRYSPTVVQGADESDEHYSARKKAIESFE